MKKKLVTLFAFITTALVLVACGGGGGGIDIVPRVEATQFSDTPVFNSNGNARVAVRVDKDLRGDLVVFEVTGTNIENIRVYNANGVLIGGSNSADFFVGPDDVDSLGARVQSVKAQQVITLPISHCIGPCVIVEKPTSTDGFYVEVKADGEANIYAYMVGFGDVEEPDNNTISGSLNLNSSMDIHHAAIETLNDIDIYAITEDGSLTIEQIGDGWNNGLEMEVVVIDTDNDEVTIPSTAFQNFLVYTGEFIVVSTKHGKAGSFDASEYSIVLY